jgi:transposase
MAFMTIDRQQNLLFPPSVDDLLPDDHLAKFVVRIVEKLDLSSIVNQYIGYRKEAYPPSLLLSLLIYAYTTGTFSSRAIERNTHDSLAYWYICDGRHPDHSTISDFRKRFAPEIASLFTQILGIAKDLGYLNLGSVFLDGTKIKADASKHHAYSYLRATEIKAQLESEVLELMKMAEDADSSVTPTIIIPEEMKIRTDKIAVLSNAIDDIVKRAATVYAGEKEVYEAKLKARAQREQETGKKTPGIFPEPPKEGPNDKDQINLTDPDSRIMPNSDKGFSQAYNAQACAEPENMLIVEAHLTQNPNDKKEMEPALEELSQLPESLGTVTKIVADAGYYSDQNVKACEDKQIEPFIAAGRDGHHPTLADRLETPPEPPADATPIQKMRHKLRTESGKAVYKLRKQVIEPIFGVIKSIIGFRKFSRRGFQNAATEWKLICMCYNVKKLHKLNS